MTEFNETLSTVFEEGTEHRLDVYKHVRTFRTDWDWVIQQYAGLQVGQGLLANSTLNIARRDLVNTLTRRGLVVDVDYALFPSHIDAEGHRLPAGNWLQYIKRLSHEVPSL